MEKTIQDKHLAQQRLRLWLQMLKATRSVESELRNELREKYGTTLPRFDVLATLLANPQGLKMSDLSQLLVVSNGNVTSIVNRLVEEGFVDRTNVESDRRAFLVKITSKGHDFVVEVVDKHLGWINEIFEDVTDADAARGISIMLDIRHKKQKPPAKG